MLIGITALSMFASPATFDRHFDMYTYICWSIDRARDDPWWELRGVNVIMGITNRAVDAHIEYDMAIVIRDISSWTRAKSKTIITFFCFGA